MARSIGGTRPTNTPISPSRTAKTLCLLFALAALSAIYNIYGLTSLQSYTRQLSSGYDSSFHAPGIEERRAQKIIVIDDDGSVEKAQIVDDETNSRSTDHPHVYKWEDLKQRYRRDHGTFYFGPHSHQITIPEDAKYEPIL
jgi:hypothetical protein